MAWRLEKHSRSFDVLAIPCSVNRNLSLGSQEGVQRERAFMGSDTGTHRSAAACGLI